MIKSHFSSQNKIKVPTLGPWKFSRVGYTTEAKFPTYAQGQPSSSPPPAGLTLIDIQEDIIYQLHAAYFVN